MTTQTTTLRPHVRTIDTDAERVLRATVSDDSRVILTPDEREFFDSRHHRDIRALMGSNRAPFLS